MKAYLDRILEYMGFLLILIIVIAGILLYSWIQKGCPTGTPYKSQYESSTPTYWNDYAPVSRRKN